MRGKERKDAVISCGGFFILTLIPAVPAVLYMPTPLLMSVCVVTIVSGMLAGALLLFRRPSATEKVYARYLLGVVVKVAGLAGVYFLLVDSPSLKAGFGFVIACYLLYFVWISYRFKVISAGS